PVTLELGVAAILLAAVTAVGFNSITTGRAVLRPIATSLAVLGITIPNFALGLSLIFLFAVKLGWLPSVGWSPWSAGIATHFTHIVLPVVTLSAYYYGSFHPLYLARNNTHNHRPSFAL